MEVPIIIINQIGHICNKKIFVEVQQFVFKFKCIKNRNDKTVVQGRNVEVVTWEQCWMIS